MDTEIIPSDLCKYAVLGVFVNEATVIFSFQSVLPNRQHVCLYSSPGIKNNLFKVELT